MPLVRGVAIAASCQMADSPRPLEARHEVVEGFESTTPSLRVERGHLRDLELARVTAIPVWWKCPHGHPGQ
jgi:hypothetical protein